jgi:hypothetical protein
MKIGILLLLFTGKRMAFTTGTLLLMIVHRFDMGMSMTEADLVMIIQVIVRMTAESQSGQRDLYHDQHTDGLHDQTW